MRPGAFLRLVRLMMKEEFRYHSAFSSKFSFMSFPVLALLLGGGLTLLLDRAGVSRADLALAAHFFIFGYGFAPASMGFFAKDIVDRRFGSVFFLYQLPAYMRMTFGETFAAFYACEITFYFLYLVLPITVGQLAMAPFTGVSITGLLVFPLSAMAVFALGLSIAFLTGALFQRRAQWFFAGVTVFSAALLAAIIMVLRNLDDVKNFLFGPSRWPIFVLMVSLGLMLSLVMTRIASAVVPAAPRPSTGTSTYSDGISGLLGRTSFLGRVTGALVAKELLDMKRSRVLSKLVFSFLLPLLILASLIWLVDRGFDVTLPINTMFYGGMIGFFGVMVYSWLNNVDSMDCYQILPVAVPDVVAARLVLFILVNTPLGLLLVLFMAVMRGELDQLVLAIPLFIMISVYMVTVTAYLAGVKPNTLLFKAGYSFKFNMLALVPLVMLGAISLAMGHGFLATFMATGVSCLLLAGGSFFLYHGVRGRWQTGLFEV